MAAMFSGLRAGVLGDNSREDERLRAAIDAVRDIRVPTAQEMQVQLEKLVQQGILTPEMAQTILMDPSAFESMDMDPTARQAELDALRGLQDVYQQGGMTAIDKARVADIQDEIGTSNRGAQQAIMQNAAERGISGSGIELGNRLIAQQSAATQGARKGLDVAAEAQKRALEAMMQSGQLAGQVYGQDYQRASDKARAADEIARFNAANKQAVINANTTARNQAQQYNLEGKQKVADANVLAANKNRVRNADLVQKEYDNRLKKAQAMADPMKNYADNAGRQQNKDEEYTQETINNIAMAAGMMSDEREKTDVSDAGSELDGLMAKLEPKKFRYRNLEKSGTAPGEQVGVMAQDLEKHPIGREMVVDTPEGKKIDPVRSLGVILAELANLSQKIGARHAD